MNRLFTFVVSGIGLTVALPAHAYVDPGTGSMAVQMIIGGIVAAAFMIKTYYYQLKRRIARLFGRDSGPDAGIDSEDAVQRTADNSADSGK